MSSLKRILSVFCIVVSISVSAQVVAKSWKQIISSSDEKWFASDEATQIAENVLLYQRNIGGWPKNIQMQAPLSATDQQKLIDLKSSPKDCTIDNGQPARRCYSYQKYISKIQM